jgi:hypothetical protein
MLDPYFLKDIMRKVKFFGFGNSKLNADITGEIWTLNDWYNFPVEYLTTGKQEIAKPARVYQIHSNFTGHTIDKTRFKDWKQKYNSSGADIIVVDDLGLKNQIFFDLESAKKKFRPEFFSSTFAYMFIDAVEQGIEHIELIGVDLTQQSEYEAQGKGLLLNIDYARENGIIVNAPREHIWRAVDWSKCESISHYAWKESSKTNIKTVTG